MSIATDVRSYADTALSQGKAALSNAGSAAVLVNKRLVADAPKPAYAALGAADLVAAAVTRRVESLPTEAVSNVGRVQQTGRVLIVRTQNDALARLAELRGRLDSGMIDRRAADGRPHHHRGLPEHRQGPVRQAHRAW